jgi:hypothetical protein
MKKILFSVSLIVILGLSSCSTLYKSGYTATPNVSMNYNIPTQVIVDTTKVLQGQSTTKVVLGIFKTEDTKFHDAFGKGIGEKEKMAAIYKALEGTNYDILVNPKYFVEINNNLFVNTTTVVVAGYGAKVKVK